MYKKWLRNSVLIVLFLNENFSFSQLKSDTLKTFLKEEIISNLNTFSSISLLDSNSQFLNLNEVLESSCPVYVKNYGKGQLATLSIRGNGASQTQLFWNGFKMNPPTLGQSDLSLIPLFFISNATLNYSGASSMDGSGGIGGSLQLSNKLKWKKGFHGELFKEFASFTNSTSGIGVSYGGDKVFHQLKLIHIKGMNDFDFKDISTLNHPNKIQINNALSQFGTQYELGIQINNRNLIQSSFLFFNSYRELPPIIGGISNKEIQEDRNFKSFVSWKSFQTKFKSDLRLSFFQESLNYIDSVSSIFSEVKVKTYQGQYRFSFSLLKRINIESSIQSSYSEVISTGFDSNENRNESGVYVKVSQDLKKFSYEVFGRQELVDDKVSPLVYGAGFRYSLFNNCLNFKSNFSTNYRVPTLNDLYWEQGGNKNLIPEKGWTAEVGMDFNSERKLKFGIIGFFNQTKNWIQWIPTDFGYWSPKNVKEIENKGIEALVDYKFSSRKLKLQIKTNYTYTHSRNKDFLIRNDERANRIPIYVPTHKANAYFSFSRNKITVFYSQLYNGRVFIDESNSTYLPHYFPANTGMSYSNKFKSVNYKIGGRINNLFNEPYQVVANRPIPGRNYSINVNLFF